MTDIEKWNCCFREELKLFFRLAPPKHYSRLLRERGYPISGSTKTKRVMSFSPCSAYRDKICQCMMSTQQLVGIHNDSAHKSCSKHTTDVKVGKVNNNKCNIKSKCKNYPGSK